MKHLIWIVLAAAVPTLPAAAIFRVNAEAVCTVGSATYIGTDTCANPLPANQMSARNEAAGYFGALSISSNAAVPGASGTAHALNRTGFQDRLQISGPALGTAAYLEMTATTLATVGMIIPDAVHLAGVDRDLDAANLTMRIEVPYRMGDVVDFRVLLRTEAFANGTCSGCTPLSIEVAQYYLDTFRVLDANKVELPNYRFWTESGFAYNFVGGTQSEKIAATPEPGGALVTAMGIAALLGLRRRRGRPCA